MIQTVHIGRGSMWGNPFLIGKDGDRSDVLQKYEAWMRKRLSGDAALRRATLALKGKALSCPGKCPPELCHKVVLEEIIKELDWIRVSISSGVSTNGNGNDPLRDEPVRQSPLLPPNGEGPRRVAPTTPTVATPKVLLVRPGEKLPDRNGARPPRPVDAASEETLGKPLCHLCPFGKNGKPGHPVLGEGPRDPVWIALGEGPGRDENRLGRPFIGRTGQFLDRALQSAGVDRKRLRVTNSMLCTPNRSTTDDEKIAAREACKPRLLAELAQHPLVPILALGRHAAQALLGDKFSISKLAGSYLETEIKGEKRGVISTIHPAAILRGGDSQGGDLQGWFLTYDILKVDKLAAGKMKPLELDKLIQTEIEEPKRARKLVRDLLVEARSNKFVSLDIETSGYDGHSGKEAHFCKLKAIGLATRERSISVLWELLDRSTIDLLGQTLRDPAIVKAGQNHTIFDQGVLTRYGLRMTGKLNDTLLLHHRAFPGATHSLQRIATQFLIIPPWKTEFRSGNEDDVELTAYNAKDCLVTAKIINPLQVIVKRNAQEENYKNSLQMAYVAERMGAWGVPFSREANRDLQAAYEPFLKESLKKLRDRSREPQLQEAIIAAIAFEQAKRHRKGDPGGFEERVEVRKNELREGKGWGVSEGWNPNSDEHVVGLLKALGVKLTRETKTGMLSTKKEILQQYADIAEARAILDYRENEKALATFIRKIPPLLDQDSRAHPSWSVHKITDRWSVDSPELHSFSKAKKRGDKRFNLRRQVMAPEGRILVGFDFKGAEARGIGFLSGDPYIVKVFNEDRDLHAELTREWLPSYDKIDADRRDAARDMTKRVEYGYFYGAVEMTLWLTVVRDYPNVKLPEIVKLVGMMNRLMPRVKAWHGELFDEVRLKGEIRGVGGARRCYPLGRFDANEVRNFTVQNLIAFLMNTGLVKLYPKLRKLKNCHPIIQHHDSLVIECMEDDADRVELFLRSCMVQTLVNAHGQSVKFPIDCKRGPSWADC